MVTVVIMALCNANLNKAIPDAPCHLLKQQIGGGQRKNCAVYYLPQQSITFVTGAAAWSGSTNRRMAILSADSETKNTYWNIIKNGAWNLLNINTDCEIVFSTAEAVFIVYME